MIVSPISPVYFPELEGPTDRSLDLEYCLCSDIICRAPQFWLADTLLNIQFVQEAGELFSSLEVVRPNGFTSPIGIVGGTGDDGRFYISAQEVDLSAFIGETISFRISLNGGSVSYDSWPVRVLEEGDCDRPLSRLVYSGSCVEQGVWWNENGVLSMTMFVATCTRSFSLSPTINSFLAGDGTTRVCSSKSEEVWTPTFDWAPLGIIRKLGFIIFTRSLTFNGADVVCLNPIAQDEQYGNYQIFRSQAQLNIRQQAVHVSACC